MTTLHHPLRHLVVLGHPQVGSFNHTLAHSYCEIVRSCGQEAEIRDLYALGFDPLLKAEERPWLPDFAPSPQVRAELERLARCDVVTLVYPIWFGLPPAIIKGYVDRVLGAGFGPASIKNAEPSPTLKDKHLMMVSSSATTRPWLEEQGQWLSLRQAFDTYLTTVFGFLGHERIHLDAIVPDSKPQYIEQCLADLHEKTREYCARLNAERHREEQARELHSRTR